MAVNPVNKVLEILNQCHDTLEWQLGNGVAVVDFLFPKIKYAISLLEQELTDGDFYSERTTGDELRANLSTYDFTDNNPEDDHFA